MKRSILHLLLAMIISSPMLNSCRKDHDPNAYHSLQIAKVKFYPGLSGSCDEAVFAYNNKGNPVSITRSIAATGATNYIFRYDRHQRLTDYAGVYQGGVIFEFWCRYYYDTRNRIAGDTVYYFGKVGNDGPVPDPAAPPPYDTLYIGETNVYYYDNKDRVIKVVRTFNGGSYGTITFNYDGAGNLAWKRIAYDAIPEYTEIVPGPYDSKVNLHRTHPVWQFIDLDFSRNNPFTAQAYNNRGLPLKMAAPDPKTASGFLRILYDTLEVEYKPGK